MNYTIRASIYESSRTECESAVKGFCTLVFGNSFKVTNIAILENKSTGELFVSMPRYLSSEKDEQGNPIYKDVCNPITKEFREELYTNILKAFERTLDDEKAVLTVDADDQASPNFKVSVTPYEKEGSSIKGFARVYINDNFVICNVSILQGSNGLFVTMPSFKTKKVDDKGKDIYRDICYPVTKEFRETLYKAIIDEYGNRKDRPEEDFADYIEQQELESGKTIPSESKDGKDDKSQDKKSAPAAPSAKAKEKR